MEFFQFAGAHVCQYQDPFPFSVSEKLQSSTTFSMPRYGENRNVSGCSAFAADNFFEPSA